MNTFNYLIPRNQLPVNIQWGDRVKANVISIVPYGIYFEYNSVGGLLLLSDMEPCVFEDFRNGLIKVGDEIETFIKVNEIIDLENPDKGTIALQGQKIDTSEMAINSMQAFCNEFSVGDLIKGWIYHAGIYGVFIALTNIQLSEKHYSPYPQIVAYYTDSDVQRKIASKFCTERLLIDCKVKEVDFQILRIVVEIDWDTLASSL